MTLLDLWMLLKKSWWLVIALPIVCALVCWGVMSVAPATYAASATLVTSGQLAIVNGQTTSVAAKKAAETGLEVTAAQNAANLSMTITAKGDDADACVRAANETALEAREKSLEFFGQEENLETAAEVAETAALEAINGPATADEVALSALALLSSKDLVTISVTEATAAQDTSPSKGKYVAVALIAGLLAAICIIVIRDMARGSIHNAYEVEEKYGLRQLGRVRASARRRSDAAVEDASLLAALDFAGTEKPAICLVPMEDSASAKRIVAELEAVAERAGKRLACVGEHADLTLTDPSALATTIASLAPADADLVFVMAPAVADSADFAYLAPACGCAVLVLEAMRTKRTHLESALRQLSLSETEVAGFIMVNVA